MSDVRKCVVSKAQTRTLVRVMSENAYSQWMLRHTMEFCKTTAVARRCKTLEGKLSVSPLQVACGL